MFAARVLKSEMSKRVFKVLFIMYPTKVFGGSGHIFFWFSKVVYCPVYRLCLFFKLGFNYMIHTDFFRKDSKIFSEICMKHVQQTTKQKVIRDIIKNNM